MNIFKEPKEVDTVHLHGKVLQRDCKYYGYIKEIAKVYVITESIEKKYENLKKKFDTT